MSNSFSLLEQMVTYTLKANGRLVAIENVPARVNLETGEQLFASETVERLKKLVWKQKKTKRMLQVPVYEYA